jgi:hypothetical protein
VIGRWPGADVHFLAATMDPVRTDRGLTVLPTATTATLRDPDLIVAASDGHRGRRGPGAALLNAHAARARLRRLAVR